ncbi:uncharacterized protein [Mobula birostris]|uniref:uncharacterized protein isoform X2 n=1 Tax=Mobula birostris TaxID=1983395 RepID=UPI003B288CAA
MMFVTSFQFPSSICPSNTNEEEGNRTRQSSVFGQSRIEKARRRAQRRRNISAEDLKREQIADRLKCPLIFMAPVILILLLLLALFGVYILKPFYKVLNFTAGNCTVLETGMKRQGSCSCDGDVFSPCLQIKVTVQLSDGSRGGAVIMENEQALVNCQQCSFTFGRHGVFADRLLDCQGWREDYDRLACVTEYHHQFGQINTTFPCFYNPTKPHEVIRKRELTWGIAVNSIVWPFLCLLGYGAAGGFVLFDCNKRSCTCLDHVLEEQTTSTPRAEASPSHPSAVFWTEQDLLNLEHMDLAVTEYTQRRPPSTYSNVFVPQEGEEVLDSETEWNALCENMDFGISEQEIEHYFNSISRRHHFRQNILPFRPFTVMNETRV